MLSLGVIATYYKGNSSLEQGIVAELHGTPDASQFRAALTSYQSSLDQMAALDKKFEELEAIDRSSTTVKAFEDALGKLLRQASPSFERISAKGVRYSNVGGTRPASLKPLRTSSDILEAQRSDLKILQRGMEEAISALKDAIPLAERGEFVKVMLSGRNAFADKMPKFTDMISAYERINIRTCMATSDATMQIYPKGLEWLQK